MKGKAEQPADIAFTVLLAATLLGHGRAAFGQCCWNHSNSLLWGRTPTRAPQPSWSLHVHASSSTALCFRSC